MTTESKLHLLQQVKKSLDNASQMLKIRESLSNDIMEIVNSISEVTEGALIVRNLKKSIWDENLDKNHWQLNPFSSSDFIVTVNKSRVNSLKSLTLFGYCINKTSGYPVLIQDDNNDQYAYSKDELITIIINIIDKKAVKIMELMNLPEEQEDDIPF